MRAYSLESFDGPAALRLVDIPKPVVDEARVIVEVAAIGINFPDLLATKGQYQHRPELPFIPGCEVAGTVIDAPEASRWNAGDRVAAFVWDSGYAERVSAVPAGLMAIPDGVPFETGAALIVNYQTVHFALTRRGGLRSGETLLVTGAGGGIGSAAVQVGRGLGARVIGGVADREQAEVATNAGAHDILFLEDGFSARARELAGGRGVDVVLDSLGDRFFGEALRALAPEGRILVVGFAAGEIPTLRVNRLLLRNASAVGVGWGAFLEVDPEITTRAAADLSAMLAQGTVSPQIGARYSFDELPEALRCLERGEIRGKAVVHLDG
jgi:NADPH2:quinone reductase